MYFVTFILKGFACGVLIALVAGCAGAISTDDRPVKTDGEPPVEKPADPSVKARRFDLVVIQKGGAADPNGAVPERFADEIRKIPGVEGVSESQVDITAVLRGDGTSEPGVLVQGWKADNYAYEGLEVTAGRKLQADDTRKVMLGDTLAAVLKRKVGDKLKFKGDPERSYEVVGVFKSPHYFEANAVVMPLADAQAMFNRKGKVTGFTVRVKKASPDSTAEVDAVKAKIEALRDPNDPALRLTAYPPEEVKPADKKEP